MLCLREKQLVRVSAEQTVLEGRSGLPTCFEKGSHPAIVLVIRSDAILHCTNVIRHSIGFELTGLTY